MLVPAYGAICFQPLLNVAKRKSDSLTEFFCLLLQKATTLSHEELHSQHYTRMNIHRSVQFAIIFGLSVVGNIMLKPFLDPVTAKIVPAAGTSIYSDMRILCDISPTMVIDSIRKSTQQRPSCVIRRTLFPFRGVTEANVSENQLKFLRNKIPLKLKPGIYYDPLSFQRSRRFENVNIVIRMGTEMRFKISFDDTG